jgi:hypothetical protein
MLPGAPGFHFHGGKVIPPCSILQILRPLPIGPKYYLYNAYAAALRFSDKKPF